MNSRFRISRVNREAHKMFHHCDIRYIREYVTRTWYYYITDLLNAEIHAHELTECILSNNIKLNIIFAWYKEWDSLHTWALRTWIAEEPIEDLKHNMVSLLSVRNCIHIHTHQVSFEITPAGFRSLSSFVQSLCRLCPQTPSLNSSFSLVHSWSDRTMFAVRLMWYRFG